MAYADAILFVPVVDLCAYGSAYGYEAIGALDPVKAPASFSPSTPRPDV